MTDQLAARGEGTDASASAPVAPTAEIEKVTAQYEDRLKGFQRMVAEKEKQASDLAARLEELESADLPADERFARRESKLASENAALKAQLEMAELRKEYGKEYDLYTGLLSKSSAKEQLDFAREFIANLAPQTPDSSPSAPDVPDVDMNNPMRKQGEGVRLSDGTILTDDIADRILNSFG